MARPERAFLGSDPCIPQQVNQPRGVTHVLMGELVGPNPINGLRSGRHELRDIRVA